MSPKEDSIKESPRQDSAIGNALVNAFTHHLLTNEMSEEQKECSGCSAYKDEDTSGNEHLSTKGIKMASTKVVTFKDILMMNSDKGVTDVVTGKVKGIAAGFLVNEPEILEDESNHSCDGLGKVENKEERKFTSYPHNPN